MSRAKREREARVEREQEYYSAAREQHRQVQAAGGFTQTAGEEPMPPYCCDYCGCLVSTARAALHRSRCEP